MNDKILTLKLYILFLDTPGKEVEKTWIKMYNSHLLVLEHMTKYVEFMHN